MDNSINILLLEDNFYDAQLVFNQVKKSVDVFEWNHVSDLIEFIQILDCSKPDIILSDYNLIGFTGLDALEIVKQKCPLIPFIIVTGNLDEETAAETIKAGAWDYVVKDRLGRLDLAIKNALELKDEKEAKTLALEKLKKSEERFTLAVDGTMDGIWDHNLETGECYYSPRYKLMLGYNKEEFDDNCKTWINLLHHDDKEPTLLCLQKHLIQELPQYQAEFRMKCKDGTYKWILGRGKATFDSSGKACRISGSNKDISESKEKEFELVQAKEKAEESDRLKTAFLNNVSHEIRTPMNAILGFSNLLNRPVLSDENKYSYTQIINSSVNRLLKIVNDILDISKIESNQLELLISNIKIKRILDQVTHDHKQSQLYISKSEIEFRTKFPKEIDDYFLNTDPNRFRQIWDNLIVNSLGFTDKGFIEIGCTRVEVNGNAPQLEFYVKDSGIGISETDKNVIFELFRQCDNDRFKEGAGLGLCITKAIVELLGGKIWFESKVGLGTTFHFTFPLAYNS
jgi:PAS domain S-box-containing protein